MVDSGCNSCLLPIEENGLKNVLAAFPFQQFKWQISMGRGVAALQSPVLYVYPTLGKIGITIATDIKPLSVEVDYLRFHLCYDDAKILVDDPLYKDVFSRDKLEKFVSQMEVLIKLSPDVKDVGKRRKHALLGQQLIGEDSIISIQYKNVFYLVNTSDPVELSLDKIVNTSFALKVRSEELIEKNFEQDEFHYLEEDDHDSADMEAYDDNIMVIDQF